MADRDRDLDRRHEGAYGESPTYTEPQSDVGTSTPSRGGEAEGRSATGEERRPRYGYYYSSALQRGSRRESESGRQGGFGRVGSQYPGTERRYGGEGYGYYGGSSQFGIRQPYGSQYVRGTGGQPNPPGEFGPGEFGGPGYVPEGVGGEASRFEEGGHQGARPQTTRGYGYDRGYDYERGYGRGGGREEWGYGRPSEGERGQYGGGYGPAAYGRPSEWDREGGREWERGRDLDREPWTEARRTRWQREGLTAGEIMTRDVKAVTKQSTIRNVAEIMKDENCGIVPVVDENHKLEGVVTDRDIVIRALAEGKSAEELKIEDIMTDDVEVVTAGEPLTEVIEVMGRKQVRRVPVVDKDDRLIGIISIGDIANRAEYDEELQDAFEKISGKRSFWRSIWS